MQRLLVILILVCLCASAGLARRRKHSKAHGKKPSAASPVSSELADLDKNSKQDDQVRLKLIDGTSVIVDEAGENEQGYWYKRGGVTYMVPRERVTSITRPPTVKLAAAPQIAKIVDANDPQVTSPARPVWIYLTGGARVEADSANEASGGVWYRRGPLAIFIERSRIERIEREDLESNPESDSTIKERGWTTGNAKIDSLIKQSGAKFGVDPYLIFCVMEQESHFSARALSPKGARGLMQLMPGTSARFGVRHPFSPGENISAGARYLKQLFDRFNGRVDLVLASYNAGEGTVIKYGHKVPPYRETRDYVRRISYRYHRAKAPVVRSPAPSGSPAIGN